MSFFMFYEKRYWKKHRRKAIAMLLSVMLVIISVLIVLLNERTVNRRKLHELYDVNGAINVTVHNVEAQDIAALSETPGIIKTGLTKSGGKIQVGNRMFAYGCCADATAQEMLHYPFLAGGYPKHDNEIAVMDCMLTGGNSNAQPGDTVYFSMLPFNEEEAALQEFRLSGIISSKMYRFYLDFLRGYGSQSIQDPDDDWSMETAVPSAFVTPERLGEGSTQTQLLMLADDSLSALPHDDERVKALYDAVYGSNSLFSKYHTTAHISFVQSSFYDTSEFTTSEGTIYNETTNSRVMRGAFLIMIVVSLISLFSIVYSVTADRIASLRLLKCIGLNKQKMLLMMVAESFLFVGVGTLLGIVAACLLHELQLGLQAMTGLAPYRGYIAEWVIQQVTVSPFPVALIFSAILFVGTSVYPAVQVCKMQFVAENKITKKRRKMPFINPLNRLFHDSMVHGLLCLSLVMVLCTASFVYLYFTKSGKNNSYAAPLPTGMNAAYDVNGINMESNQIDCVLTGDSPNRPDGAGIQYDAVGMDSAFLAALPENATVHAWGRWASSATICCEKDDEIHNSLLPYQYDATYFANEPELFADKALFSVPVVFFNDAMMQEFGVSESSNVVVLTQISVSPWQENDNIPLLLAAYDSQNKLIQPESVKVLPVPVDQVRTLDNGSFVFNAYLGAVRGLLGADLAIVIRESYAEEIGLTATIFSSATIQWSDKVSDGDLTKILNPILPDTVSYQTLHQLRKKVIQNRISELSSILILFLLFMILVLIGYYNVLQMYIDRNLEKYDLMHQIGMSHQQIRKRIFSASMRIPVIAGLLSSVAVFLFQTVLKLRYIPFAAMVEKGLEDYPEVQGQYLWLTTATNAGRGERYEELQHQLYGIVKQ